MDGACKARSCHTRTSGSKAAGDKSHRCRRQRNTAPCLKLIFAPLHVSRELGTHHALADTQREEGGEGRRQRAGGKAGVNEEEVREGQGESRQMPDLCRGR